MFAIIFEIYQESTRNLQNLYLAAEFAVFNAFQHPNPYLAAKTPNLGILELIWALVGRTMTQANKVSSNQTRSNQMFSHLAS
jgi:hypothetical protein